MPFGDVMEAMAATVPDSEEPKTCDWTVARTKRILEAMSSTIAVIGATGFVGSHLVPHLVKAGHRVIAVSRDGRRLPEWTDGVDARAGDVTAQNLDAAIQGADAVVHLVAIARESRGKSFGKINVDGTRRAVEAAERAGVKRFVHLSAMGVTDDPKLGYLYSKWLGEQAVRDSSLDWVVLRPSLLFGKGDGFFNLVKTTLKWWSPGVVVIPGKGDARFQPLSVDDLAVGIEQSVTDAGRSKSVYELGGPEWVTVSRDRGRGEPDHRHEALEAGHADPAHQRPHRGDRQGAADLPGQPRPDQLAAAAELHRARRVRARLRCHAAADGPLLPGLSRKGCLTVSNRLPLEP